MTKEALKLALEALDDLSHYADLCELFLKETHPGKAESLRKRVTNSIKAITAIKEALAQPEQEPVAWTLLLTGENNGLVGKAGETFEGHPEYYRRVDVYTTPPQRKPLTDEEIRRANHHMVDGAYDYSFKQGVKWAEYKHGIKGEA